ncbi:MAG: hypothetical protein ABW049_10840 [Spongiibacteraceae bacterium]
MLTESDSNKLLEIPYRTLWEMQPTDIEQFQLHLLQQRFEKLRPKIQALGKLAELQGVDRIAQLNDVVPILFQHSAYKSYPISLLEKGKYDALTKWLDKLTSHDLSTVDASDCHSIDEWLQLLDDVTELRVVHSSGTSGKLSLIPRDQKETHRFTICTIRRVEGFGDEPDLATPLLKSGKKMAVIYPSYRYGRYGAHRLVQDVIECYGTPENSYALHEELMSADVVSLSGRVAGAQAKGELDRLKISDALLQKYKESIALRASQSEKEKHFLDRVIANCQGQDVIMLGVVSLMLEWVRMARERGLDKLFGANSLLLSGGGAKGLKLPDDWREQITQTLGVEPNISYGMSECITQLPSCSAGNYHSTPYIIAFVLDPETGAPLPRTGTQTGRYGFYDLLAESYWGGFITGDKVTAHWDGCACGRSGFHVEPTIVRYSSISDDGDDKINCAGAADAHERALDFLNDLAQQT